ncbi:PREDICTED: serpin B12-like [Chrysochloris asiatica]|uniref:Serpin B12-like n=1 Tax=Chrysochloris asiatica TaxID=185453 RepID=A0A9B0TCB4_CHRAS|nr:PREDICTED: serpin B12-like [Chrysochloris asiatica]
MEYEEERLMQLVNSGKAWEEQVSCAEDGVCLRSVDFDQPEGSNKDNEATKTFMLRDFHFQADITGGAMDMFSAANAQFCFDVFREMSYDHTTENLFFSPLGLLSTLAVVLFGARGESASQIEKKYSDCMEQLYKVKPENLDFKSNIEDTRMQINSWIENKTKGEIKGLWSYDDIMYSDELVLINAVSFQGKWKHVFQKDQTKTMVFRLDESQSKPVQMMQLQGVFKLGSIQEAGVQVLEMPDVEGHLSLVIILPTENVSLGQVLREITYEKLKSWISPTNMADTAVDLHLPQLRLDGCQGDYTSILATLGMTDVLDPSVANLSGITVRGGLVVSRIIHTAILKVTEDDYVLSPANSAGQVKNLQVFQVDHPFLISVLQKDTEALLFYGVVSNP